MKGLVDPEALAMRTAALIFSSERRFRAAQRLGRMGAGLLASNDGAGQRWITALPGYLGGWTSVRDLHAMPSQTFREWFEQRAAHPSRAAEEGS